MSLSRQERRRLARENEKQRMFDRRYGRQVEERQNKVDDRTVAGKGETHRDKVL